MTETTTLGEELGEVLARAAVEHGLQGEATVMVPHDQQCAVVVLHAAGPLAELRSDVLRQHLAPWQDAVTAAGYATCGHAVDDVPLWMIVSRTPDDLHQALAEIHQITGHSDDAPAAAADRTDETARRLEEIRRALADPDEALLAAAAAAWRAAHTDHDPRAGATPVEHLLLHSRHPPHPDRAITSLMRSVLGPALPAIWRHLEAR